MVDDDRTFAKALTRFLERAGYKVVVASCMHEALAAAHGSQPRIVVLDLALPDGSGWELLEELRDRVSPSRCIVVSGTRVSRAEVRGRGLGVALLNPVPPQELRRLMQLLSIS